VRIQVLNKREQVNAFDIERLPIRKFEMRNELSEKKEKVKVACRSSGESTHVNTGLSRGLYDVVDGHLHVQHTRTEETSASLFSFVCRIA
jgi:hypothetical protein